MGETRNQCSGHRHGTDLTAGMPHRQWLPRSPGTGSASDSAPWAVRTSPEPATALAQRAGRPLAPGRATGRVRRRTDLGREYAPLRARRACRPERTVDLRCSGDRRLPGTRDTSRAGAAHPFRTLVCSGGTGRPRNPRSECQDGRHRTHHR